MIFLYLFALVAGVANAFQAGTNATLAKSLKPALPGGAARRRGQRAELSPPRGSHQGRLSWPTAAAFGEVPWWGWLGGLLSAVLLMSQLFVAELIGAGPFLGIIVVTGTVASLLIENYGWVGFKVHELNLWRVVGGALMGVGVLLVALF